MIYFFLKLVSLCNMTSTPGIHPFAFIESVHESIMNKLQNFQPGREKDLYENACEYAFKQITNEISGDSFDEEEVKRKFKNKIKNYVERQQT